MSLFSFVCVDSHLSNKKCLKWNWRGEKKNDQRAAGRWVCSQQILKQKHITFVSDLSNELYGRWNRTHFQLANLCSCFNIDTPFFALKRFANTKHCERKVNQINNTKNSPWKQEKVPSNCPWHHTIFTLYLESWMFQERKWTWIRNSRYKNVKRMSLCEKFSWTDAAPKLQLQQTERIVQKKMMRFAYNFVLRFSSVCVTHFWGVCIRNVERVNECDRYS